MNVLLGLVICLAGFAVMASNPGIGTLGVFWMAGALGMAVASSNPTRRK
jgi:hypothetical protein